MKAPVRGMVAIGLSALALTGAARPAMAGEAADRLTRCLVKSATEADRTRLVQWIFSAMLANPALQSLATATPAQREGAARGGVEVLERLITADCRKEAVAAIHFEHGAAFAEAFKSLGEVAGRDILSNGASAAELKKSLTYLDRGKLIDLGMEAATLTDAEAPKAAR